MSNITEKFVAFMSENDKMNIVFFILILIFSGFIIYLKTISKRLKKIERNIAPIK
jgi:hypothetical protein